jgi:HK97 family phage major capsid protein
MTPEEIEQLKKEAAESAVKSFKAEQEKAAKNAADLEHAAMVKTFDAARSMRDGAGIAEIIASRKAPAAAVVSPETAERRKAFTAFLRTGDATALRTVTKGMSIGSDPDGGYTCPPELANEILTIAQNYSPLRNIARVVGVSRANYKAIISTTLAGAEWRAETDTRNDTGSPTLAEIAPPSGELSSVAPVTNWLLNDSEYDVEAFIAQEIGKAHGIAEGAAFINGSGANQPKGLMQYTFAATGDDARAFGQIEKFQSVVTGASGDISPDDIFTVLYKLRPAYRKNAAWLMHPDTLAFVRKMKTTTADYLWEPAMKDGQPSTLLGAPVYEDANMPKPDADSLSILVGDFKAAYHIVDVGSPTLIRDNVTDKGRTKFYVARRVGGALVDSCAIKALQFSAAA